MALDAALYSGSKSYFVDGNRYMRVTRGDVGVGTVDAGYPKNISVWGWSAGFGADGIGAAVYSGSNDPPDPAAYEPSEPPYGPTAPVPYAPPDDHSDDQVIEDQLQDQQLLQDDVLQDQQAGDALQDDAILGDATRKGERWRNLRRASIEPSGSRSLTVPTASS